MKQAVTRAFVLLMVTSSLTGCVVLAVGAAATAAAGGAVYVKGQLKETLDGTVPQVHRAAYGALNETGVMVTTDLQDDFSGQLEGEMADGTQVWIDADRVTASTTRITIRVGYMGDHAKSSQILERTKRHLYGL
jgi:hypothetical protein